MLAEFLGNHLVHGNIHLAFPQRVGTGQVSAAGPVVRVELATGSGGIVHAELPQERYRVLGLQRGAEVYVSVKDMKVFTSPHGTSGAGI